MNQADALDLMRAAVWVVLTAAGPAVAAALIVGLALALFPALPPGPEVTLTFVPQIIIILLVIIATAPFMGAELQKFTGIVYSRIEKGF